MRRISILSSSLVLVLGAITAIHVYRLSTSHAATANAAENGGRIERSAVGNQDQPDAGAAYWARLTQAPKGQNPALLNLHAQQQVMAATHDKALASEQRIPLAFEDLGSGAFGGRVRALVVSPDDADVAVLGGVSGGFWKTTDGGASWHGIDDFLPTLAISSLLVDPDDSQRLFAGTGEGFFNADAQRGAGIFVSEDFGDSWTQLPATTGVDFNYVNRLARVAGSDTLLAATRTGIYRSPDLGQNWSEVSGVPSFGRGFVDLKADPSDAQHLMAVQFGNDTGTTPVLRINSPASLAGELQARGASFGPAVLNDALTANVTLANDGTAPGSDACQPISNSLNGRIALIDRGTCLFVVKVKHAQDAGALGVVIINNNPNELFTLGGSDDTITIPSLMVFKADGDRIRDTLSTQGVNATFGLSSNLLNFVMQSRDGGQHWNKLGGANGLPASDVSRMELAFGDDGVVYVAAAAAPDKLKKEFKTRGLYRSTNGGDNFQLATDAPIIEKQGWYDLAVAVDPSDSSSVFTGALNMFRSINDGKTQIQRSFQNPQPGQVAKFIHADHHVYTFGPDGSLWAGTDGGVYRSDDGGNVFRTLNHGFHVAQTYAISINPDGTRVAAGNQDNGTQLYFGDAENWVEINGGDGAITVWDPQDSQFMFGEMQNGKIFGSGDGGLTRVDMPLPDGSDPGFIAPLAIDPNNGQRLLSGAERVYLSENSHALSNATWVGITDPDAALSPGAITMVRFDPFDSGVGYVGDFGGNLFRIDGLGSTNTLARIDAGVFNGDITSLEIDPFDSSGRTLYVTTADYGSNRVFKSIDGGVSWQSIHANLPDIPTFTIVSDPVDPDRLWLGSELGLWTSLGNTSGNFAWQHYDYGTAFTRVVTLKWNDPSTLYIGTHGRGTFKAVRTATDIEIGNITTQAGCDDDQFIDLGETASVPLQITNLSGQALTGAAVTLSSTYPDLMISPSSLVLGTLAAHGTTTAPFTLTIGQLQGSCLDRAELTASLISDQGMQLGDLHLTLAADPVGSSLFVADAESADPVLINTSALGDTPWRRRTSLVHSGAQAWFVPDPGHFADSRLATPWLDVGTASTQLSFWLNYSTDSDQFQRRDGVLLEMRSAAEPERWFDIGERSSVPYDGSLFINNTARGRLAWSGLHAAWRHATVDLGSEYNGQRVQFRFRMVADQIAGRTGFSLDDMEISNVSQTGAAACDLSRCVAQIVPRRGLAFDPVRNGHGLELQKAGDTYFVLFYSYGDDGTPEWFLGTGSESGGVVTIPMGQLDRFSYDFNAQAANVVDGAGGGASLDFNIDPADPLCAGADRSNSVALARFDWDIEGEQGSWCTQLLVFDPAITTPDVSGTWFAGPQDDGWGMTLASQGSTLVAVLYFYDANGDARWLLGSGAYTPGQAAQITMQQFQGFCRTCTPTRLGEMPSAGTLSITLSKASQLADPGNLVSVDVTYQGVAGSTWQRTDAPIRQLSEPLGN